MWHAVTPVSFGYDPILYESPQPADVLALNAGPGIVQVRSWPAPSVFDQPPQMQMELRPGDQRILSGCLVRAHLDPNTQVSPANFAAVAWTILYKGI